MTTPSPVETARKEFESYRAAYFARHSLHRWLGIVVVIGALGVTFAYGIRGDAYEVVIAVALIGIVSLAPYSSLVGERGLRVDNAPLARPIGLYKGAELQLLIKTAYSRMALERGSAASAQGSEENAFEGTPLPVYIVRSAEANASAWGGVVAPFFPRLPRVTINRTLLHHLPSEELLAVIAHEVAHIVRFQVHGGGISSSLIAGACGAAITAVFALHPMAIAMIALPLSMAISFVSQRSLPLSVSVEYLCDEAEAKVAGAEAAIRSHLITATLSACDEEVWAMMVDAVKRSRHLTLAAALKIFEQGMPFERPQECGALKELMLDKLVKAERERGDLSWEGFLEFIGIEPTGANDTEAIAEFEAKRDELMQYDLLPWSLKDVLGYSREELGVFLKTIRSMPENTLLVRSESELPDRADRTHPSVRERILAIADTFLPDLLVT